MPISTREERYEKTNQSEEIWTRMYIRHFRAEENTSNISQSAPLYAYAPSAELSKDRLCVLSTSRTRSEVNVCRSERVMCEATENINM